jgi:hypothetical protein
VTNAFILAAAPGLLSSRRIADDIEIITVPPGVALPPGAQEKRDAQRREADRAREEERRRERARVNFLPHGSDREARRRRRQIARGQLKAENGLAR